MTTPEVFYTIAESQLRQIIVGLESAAENAQELRQRIEAEAGSLPRPSQAREIALHAQQETEAVELLANIKQLMGWAKLPEEGWQIIPLPREAEQ